MSEDFDGDPSDRAGLSLACVLAASAARRGKSELVTTGAPVVTEEMYIKPSQAQVDYNANIVANPEGKQPSQNTTKTHVELINVEGVEVLSRVSRRCRGCRGCRG